MDNIHLFDCGGDDSTTLIGEMSIFDAVNHGFTTMATGWIFNIEA